MRVCIIIVLSLWMDLTSGMMNIQLIPQYPVIGGSVTLSVTGITGRIPSFSWYKGPNTNPVYQILTYILGDPSPQINGPLYFSRARPFPNGSLLISDLHLTDRGDYIVSVQTENPAEQTSVTLTVYERVSKPKLIAPTSLPKENHSITLTCDTSNAERILWSRGSVGLPSGPILSADNRTVTFPKVTRADSGEYRCEAENSVSKSISDPYTVTVSFLSLWMDLTSGMMNIQLIPQYPVIQEFVTLSVTGISGKIITFSWYKGPNTNAENQILTYIPGDPSPQINGPLYFSRARPLPAGSLLISDLHITDSGNYILRIQTEKPAEEASVTLTVYERVSKPKVIASTSLPKENVSLTLTCDTSNAERILWSRGSVSLPSGPILSADNRTVTFPNVTRADSGEYRCEAENQISKSISDPYTVTVSFLSLWMDLTSGVMNIQLIPQYPVLGEHVIGGSVTLSVTGITGRILTFRWYKGPNTNAEHQILTYVPGDPASQINGSLYFSRARPFPNGSLLISDLHPTDSGNYIVNVQTERSAFEASVTLTVYDLISYPKVIASTSLPIENDPFTLTCDSSNAEKIHWTKDRVSLPSGPILSADHRTVTFPNVTRADSGEYRCEAENPISKSISDPYRVTVCEYFLWMDLTSGMVNIQLIPQYPVIQESVTLSVTGITERILSFSWYKGRDQSPNYQILTYIAGDPSPHLNGPLYFSRARPFPNGSLLISDLHITDSGNYIVSVQTKRSLEETSVPITIYERVSKPAIAASHSQIQENDTVTLTCVSANAEKITWSRDNAILQHGDGISGDNRSITFSNIKHRKKGGYTCEAENLVNKRTSDVYTLTVLYEETEEDKSLLNTDETISTFLNDTSEYSAHTNTAITAGLISGTILAILLIISVSFLLYRRCVFPAREVMTGSPSVIRDSYAIYDNVLDQPMPQKSKEDPSYMCLQFQSEGVYNELDGQDYINYVTIL
ncbi:cell adhesion molecule CEACAM5-like isoform X2 [Mixophyes fleayi]|uniref:cell adhesion molecule CEACAM5-like isoform X2 n=1 Tax=Mixophyes fleayi TaxID=3061075 RepID=UPI003F4E161E